MPESAIKFGAYEVLLVFKFCFYYAERPQGSKRLASKLEGHNDTKAISGGSQFFAAGMGGVISQ